MANPKPVLGYPSHTVAMLALQAQGLSRADIAGVLECTENTVKVLLHKARVRTRAGKMDVAIGLVAMSVLAAAALDRGVKANALASAILQRVLEDDLIAAVMDDDPDTEQWVDAKLGASA